MENQLQTLPKNAMHIADTDRSLLAVSKPITECKDEDIKQPIRYALALIGLPASKTPNDMEKLVHLKFIKENYPDYTPDEIKYAFEKAMARKFGPNVNVTCYENFSCEYIGRILSAYEQWDGYEHLKSVSEHRIREDEDEIRYEIHQAYENFINEGRIQHFTNNMYWILVQDGFIERITGPRARRVYPKQRAILSGFAQHSRSGHKELYKKFYKNKELPAAV